MKLKISSFFSVLKLVIWDFKEEKAEGRITCNKAGQTINFKLAFQEAKLLNERKRGKMLSLCWFALKTDKSTLKFKFLKYILYVTYLTKLKS